MAHINQVSWRELIKKLLIKAERKRRTCAGLLQAECSPRAEEEGSGHQNQGRETMCRGLPDQSYAFWSKDASSLQGELRRETGVMTLPASLLFSPSSQCSPTASLPAGSCCSLCGLSSQGRSLRGSWKTLNANPAPGLTGTRGGGSQAVSHTSWHLCGFQRSWPQLCNR